MANLFASGAPSNLEQALNDQASQKIAGINDQGIQARKKLVAQQAASGRLTGGVSNYNIGDLDSSVANQEAGVYSGLADALGSIPTEDWENQQEYQRKLALAKYIGSLNKPSGLQGALGGALSGATSGAMVGGPWGALAGGVAGGGLGYAANA